MSQADISLLLERSQAELKGIRTGLRRLELRDWWHWGVTFFLILLLVGAVAALSSAILLRENDVPFQLHLSSAVRGLVALVLLFTLNTIYQQTQIRRLRHGLTEQIDVAARLAAQALESQQLALLDPLTGLCNRRFAERQLQIEMARSDRHGYPLTVLALDINGLKQINDNLGHAAGDLAIQSFAGRLKKALRSSDWAARVGGDEFLVILPECPRA